MFTCAALWVALDTQACSSWYQSVPGGSLGAMAAASAASLDPEFLVDTFLWEKARLRRTYMDHQLLKAREKATKRELEIIYRKLSLILTLTRVSSPIGAWRTTQTWTRTLSPMPLGS